MSKSTTFPNGVFLFSVVMAVIVSVCLTRYPPLFSKTAGYVLAWTPAAIFVIVLAIWSAMEKRRRRNGRPLLPKAIVLAPGARVAPFD